METDSLQFLGCCPLCQSKERKLRFPSTLNNQSASTYDYIGTNTGYRKYHEMYSCSNCHICYMDPIDKEVESLCQDVIDVDYLKTWDERALNFQDHLTILAPYIKSGKLLDIGCYAGIFLEVAKSNGFDIEGIEPSKWAADIARTKNQCIIHNTSVYSANPAANSFDLVTLWDVIEHLASPRASLEKAYLALKSKGIIAVSTHDIESTFAKVLGPNYPWLMRFHLVHFSPKTLAELLEQTGFNILEIKKYKKPLSIRYFLQRIGLNFKENFFTKQRVAFNTGDLFIVIAQKK